jgi:hypothetical protein
MKCPDCDTLVRELRIVGQTVLLDFAVKVYRVEIGPRAALKHVAGFRQPHMGPAVETYVAQHHCHKRRPQ